MRKILLILAFLITGFGADAAAPRATNARAGRGGDTTPTTATTAARGRAATQTPTAPTTRTTITSSQSAQRTSGNAASTSGAPSGAVVSRAAKQSVISTGTKVTAAAQNTVVNEKCWNGFMGCMDSFCMLDNANGGRCMCSDKNAEYDSILAEIQSLDEQSYQMATVGVERIEMGDDADAVIKKTQEITKSIEQDSTKSKRKSLDLSAWNFNEIDFDADTEDIFSLGNDASSITNKTGDALYRAATKLCNTQMPECKSQSTMMDLMYKQRVRSDCTAYENSLRQQRAQSAQKLATAQSAMREAALEQYRNANKYDLGQCTVQFKQCMQTTGGCGEDFSGCVDYSVRESLLKTDTNGNTKAKSKTIKGTSSKITLLAATYDVLESKKELCMSVTQQCVNVRDQVWDTFLREVAPQVKSAELMAESNMRTSCISNIANCFQKACKENMDPNDPDGSYDMCLTRPDTLRTSCKVEIDPCEGAIPNIMTYVTARLASMRVDSCTKEFKQCLTSEDRCGVDYTQCVGLDTDTIVKMCPRDKLVGCYNSKKPEQDVYTELAEVATGIFLNIDNNMLTACQRAADAAMIKVCGSTENCDDLVVNNGFGSRSLEYKICEYTGNSQNLNITYNQCRPNIDMITDEELGRNDTTVSGTGQNVTLTTTANKRKDLASVIDGRIYWESVTVDDDGKLISAVNYFNKLGADANSQLTESQKQRITGELAALQTSINTAIDAIESDQTVQYCMTGREFQGMNNRMLGTRSKRDSRFPNLTKQMRDIITSSALSATKENYYAKYDELNQKMLKDYSKIAERVAEIKGENNKDLRRDIARDSCINLAESSVLARSAEPPKSAGTYILGGNALMSGLASPVPGAAIAGIVMSAIILSSANDDANGQTYTPKTTGLTGSQIMQQWNYKETVTTTFDWDNLICHKCVRSTKCEVTKNPLIGDKYCGTWGEETETCTDIQF